MTLFSDIAPAAGFDLSGDPFIDSLYSPEDYFRTKWATVSGGKTQISYSFAFLSGVASKFTSDYGKEPTAAQHFGVTNAQIPGIDQAFQRWADVANVSFTKVAETAAGVVGDIRIAFSSEVSSDFWGYTKIFSDGSDPSQGDIWIEPSIKDGTFQPFTYDFLAMMHEIGHALGLDHPFEGNIIPAGYDNARYTIMSYTQPKGVFYFQPGATEAQYILVTPMIYDIAAVQKIYGANMSYHTGNDVYAFQQSQPVYQTIWDAGGNDTIDVTSFKYGCTISLTAGTYSQLAYGDTTLDPNLGIAFGCTIENARGGSGDDTLNGNDAANQLFGNAGRDTLTGSGGNDIIDGGAGDDVEVGGDGNDIFMAGTDSGSDSFDGGSGTDTITYAAAKAAVTVKLAAGTAAGSAAGDAAGIGSDVFQSIETVIGSAFNDTLIGSTGADTFTGGAGNDTINGGGGFDTASYAGAKSAVTVNLALTTAQNTLGGGTDTLSAIENLIGTAFNDTLTGNQSANVLDGGAGADVMAGGLGNDTYRVDAAGDRVTEAAEAGRDIVIASVSFTLGANIENLTLAGTAAINGTGNDLANTIRGNAGANVLSGGGASDQLIAGAGADTLIGGAARDFLTGGAGADVFRFANGDFGGTTTATCDLIYDFSHAEGDRIDLSAIDANAVGGGANDAFAFIGSAAFGNVAGQLRVATISGLSVVQGDINGDGLADFWIRCNGGPALAAADFVL